jgi:glycosyltransferase involved in cell wall biosynthesis
MSDPQVAILFPAAGRRDRRDEAITGNGPKEFFYGGLAYGESHAGLVYGDTRANPDSFMERLLLPFTRARNMVTNFGLVRPRVAALAGLLSGVDAVFSFTDAFSVSLGYYRRMAGARAVLAGGFHGLCDMIFEVKAPFRPFARRAIQRGVAGLDVAFFFGPADREEAIRRFGLARERTFLFPFGVDTDFWSPAPSDAGGGAGVFAAGSDPKRDYACLLNARSGAPMRILTRLKLPGAEGRSDLEVIRGSFHAAAITDQVLRDLYRTAAVVVVPVRDVFQPSGYSVALQAMACGKPIVLSRNKGLWDPEVFESGRNCILVRPEDPAELRSAIQALIDDPGRCAEIGAAARETALTHFPLARMNAGLERLVETALSVGRKGD